MKVVKCAKCGKWYNSDAFAICPICNPTSIEQKPVPKKSEVESEVEDKRTSLNQEPEDISPFRLHGEINSQGKTDSIWKTKQENAVREAQRGAIVESQSEPEDFASLQTEVKRATASSAGKTVSVFQSMSKERENSQRQAVNPTVGWLVCIGGPHLGQDFVMHAGKNTIGRNDNNEIILSNDSQVSREKHALIIYEPRKRNFYLQPGDSSGLTYLNDEFISEQKSLKKGDLIEIGSTKLLVIPLCGEDFSWDEYYMQGDRS